MSRLNALTHDIRELRSRLSALERINQSNILSFGDITLNGDTGQITVGSGDEIVIDGTTRTITVGTSGEIILNGNDGIITAGANEEVVIDGLNGLITFNQQSTSGTDSFLRYKNTDGDVVGLISFGTYNPGIEVSSLRSLVYDQSSEDDRITYNTMQIHEGGTSGARLSTFEISHSFSGGLFDGAGINYGALGVSATFGVSIDDDTTGYGFLNTPKNDSDPTASGVRTGTIYYNTVSGKLKVNTGAGWQTITST